MCNTGNDMGKFPMKPTLPEPLETSPNTSPTHPSQTTSLPKVLPSPNRRRTMTLALPRARAQLLNRKSPLLLTFLKTQERQKANSPGVTVPQQALPLLWHLWTHHQGLSKIHLGFLQSPSIQD